MFLLTSMIFSSCATVVSKSRYPVSINSNPSGANITVTNKKGNTIFAGQSPATVILKPGAGFFSKAKYQVKFSLSDYSEKTYPIEFKFNGWYLGNILIGGVIGMLIVDPATGAMWTLPQTQRNITATLERPTAIKEPALKIIDMNNLSTSMQNSLIRVK